MAALTAALRLPVVLLRHRELLWAFVRRELKSRIEGSVLGRLWPLIQPAVLFAIYFLVFAQVLKIPLGDDLAPHGPENTGWRSTFFLITGILPWTAFAEGISRGTGVVLENANLIKKIAFPSELLPTYTTIVFHVYFFVGFVILLAMELAVNGGLPWGLLWLPAVVLVQFVFINGVAMFLSAANIFIRDVNQAVPVLVVFGMFTTPVFFNPASIVDQGRDAETRLVTQLGEAQAELGRQEARQDAAEQEVAAARQWVADTEAELVPVRERLETARLAEEVMSYNPMAALLSLYRSIFSYGKVPFPLVTLLKLGLVALLAQWLAYAFFLRCKGRFADEV